jgi:hypothetical protein
MGLGLGLSATLGYTPFTLTSVSSLALWLQNGVGVTVGQWDDSSGNNNHATQGTSANQAAVSGGGLDFEEGETDHYDLASTITIAENQGFCFAASAGKMLLLVNRTAGASNVFTFFKNGTQIAPNPTPSTNAAQGQNPFGFDLNVIGTRPNVVENFDGIIHELAFWTKGLSTTEIADVNSYLKGIHGL